MKYLAVVVDFLDRESGRITRKLCYPVTGVYLIEDPHDFNHNLKAFTVSESDSWQQVEKIPERTDAERVAMTSDERNRRNWKGEDS